MKVVRGRNASKSGKLIETERKVHRGGGGELIKTVRKSECP